jgi:hypothetical protein
MTKLVFAFRKLANAPKKGIYSSENIISYSEIIISYSGIIISYSEM